MEGIAQPWRAIFTIHRNPHASRLEESKFNIQMAQLGSECEERLSFFIRLSGEVRSNADLLTIMSVWAMCPRRRQQLADLFMA
ncbi:hypothetical protein NDU88_002471 [Pleurodeles waltl]|uniref:Uncharacterized protein n=1 Tax=Pleurodeles waltl TaxID=8319 RepID=A0AAV7LFS1_PLEWA|nr:hypothetical protein NDU88_002471 [Pleurodeles waltl]